MAVREIIIGSGDVQDINHCNRVIAGPGAGKTYWIVGQICHILQSEVLRSTSKVACITYTNKAAQNIVDHIDCGGKELYVSTIHTFLYAHIIKPYFHLIADAEEFAIEKLDGHHDDVIIGYGTLIKVIPSKKKYLVNEFKDYSSLEKYIGKYYWHLSQNSIELRSANNNQSPLKGFGKDEVMQYKKFVWRDYGLMHHDDVLYFSYKLIATYPCIVEMLSAQFPYILVDEYQDTNSIQHHILQCLANVGTKVTIIGDKAQSIYRFAGSDIKNLTSFKAPDLQCYRIKDNHRSTPSIVKFLNSIRIDLSQKAILRKDYGPPVILTGNPIETYNKAKAMCNNEEITSLCWSNSTANLLRLNLQTSGSQNFLHNLLNNTSNKKRAHFTYYCLLGVENARLELMNEAVYCIARAFELNTRILEDKQNALHLLLEILKKESVYRNSTLSDFYTSANALRKEPLPKLQNGTDATLFSNNYLAFAKDVHCNDEDSPHLTIHKAKGLEFNNVILIFTETDKAMSFLLTADLDSKQDDSRLYYVACSRAKHRLFISTPTLDDPQKLSLEEKYGEEIVIDKS